MDDQEAVERFHEDAIVRGDRRAGLPVICMFLDEALHRSLVHRPRLLEVGDRFGDAVFLDTMVDFLPDPSHALGEAERHREHFAVPARDQGVRVRDRGHVHHAILADPLDLPRTAADDEMQALPRLDHHELLPEDADLLLGREVHDLVPALVANRGEVLEVVPASLRRHTDPVPLLAQDPEVVEELRDAVRRRVLEFAARFGGPDGRQDLRPGGRAASTRSRSSRGREPWWTATSWRTMERREPRSSASGRALTKTRVDRLSSSVSSIAERPAAASGVM